MPHRLVIFDLDGTLVDSFPWFLRNLNGVADKFGFHRVTDDDVGMLRRAGLRRADQVIRMVHSAAMEPPLARPNPLACDRNADESNRAFEIVCRAV